MKMNPPKLLRLMPCLGLMLNKKIFMIYARLVLLKVFLMDIMELYSLMGR